MGLGCVGAEGGGGSLMYDLYSCNDWRELQRSLVKFAGQLCFNCLRMMHITLGFPMNRLQGLDGRLHAGMSKLKKSQGRLVEGPEVDLT